MRVEKHLLFIFFLFFFMFPTSFGAGFKILSLFIFCLTGLFFLIVRKDLNFSSGFIFYFFVFLIVIVSTVASGAYGISLSNDAIMHWPSLLRVIYFFSLILFFGAIFHDADDRLRNFCAKVLLFFISIQLFILIFQAFGFSSWLSIFYIQDKMRGLESYMRATGSFGNPNTLAIVTTLSMIVIWFFSQKKSLIFFSVAFTGIIVILTGSRTGLFIYIFAVGLCVLFGGLSRSWRFVFGAIFLSVCVGLWSISVILAEFFPYTWQALKVVTSPELLLEVSSMKARVDNWQSKIGQFQSVESIAKFFFGIGYNENYKVLDNEYLFLYLRLGLLGILSFSSFIIFPFLYVKFFEKKLSVYSVPFIIIVFVGFLWGLLFEFYSDFIMSVMLYMVIGMLSSVFIFKKGVR